MIDFLTTTTTSQISKTNYSTLTLFRQIIGGKYEVALKLFVKPRLLDVTDLKNVNSDLVTINNYIDNQISNVVNIIVGSTTKSVTVKGNNTKTITPVIGVLGKTGVVLFYDGALAAPGTWLYDNTTDTLTLGTQTAKNITLLYT